jgi:hypothetical protein
MRPRAHPSALALSAEAATERDEAFRKRNFGPNFGFNICNYSINCRKSRFGRGYRGCWKPLEGAPPRQTAL